MSSRTTSPSQRLQANKRYVTHYQKLRNKQVRSQRPASNVSKSHNLPERYSPVFTIGNETRMVEPRTTCESRSMRKQVLFALSRTKGGAGATRRVRTPQSKVKCK